MGGTAPPVPSTVRAHGRPTTSPPAHLKGKSSLSLILLILFLLPFLLSLLFPLFILLGLRAHPRAEAPGVELRGGARATAGGFPVGLAALCGGGGGSTSSLLACALLGL